MILRRVTEHVRTQNTDILLPSRNNKKLHFGGQAMKVAEAQAELTKAAAQLRAIEKLRRLRMDG